MRFTGDHVIPVRDRRRRRRTNRYGAYIGALGVFLTALSDARVLPVFPHHWHPYIVAGGVVALALGVFDRIERDSDARRYLERLQGNDPNKGEQ